MKYFSFVVTDLKTVLVFCGFEFENGLHFFWIWIWFNSFGFWNKFSFFSIMWFWVLKIVLILFWVLVPFWIWKKLSINAAVLHTCSTDLSIMYCTLSLFWNFILFKKKLKNVCSTIFVTIDQNMICNN